MSSDPMFKVPKKEKLRVGGSHCPRCQPSTANRITGLFFGNASCTCNQDRATESDRAHSQKSFSDEPWPDLGEDYEVMELVGEGGMGRVFKVRIRSSGSIVAVKVLRSVFVNDAEALKRFQLEVEAISKCSHENLIAVYGHGLTSQMIPYLVMEYLEGENLSLYMKRVGAWDERTLLDVFSQVGAALSEAHGNGIIHRDLKPSNVFVCADNDLISVKLVDFGIAKLMPAESSQARETQDLTKTGDVFGTPDYMSPEQCLGFKLDHRSDVYSFGCLMYEVLSGKPPFASDNPIQTVIKHINDEPPPLSTKGNKEVRKFESIVFRCLEKDMDDRYQSMDELLRDISVLKAGQVKTKNRVKYKEPKARLTRYQVALLGGSLVCSLGIFWPFATGLASALYPVWIVCAIAALVILFSARRKLALPQPEHVQWLILRCWLLLALGVVCGICLTAYWFEKTSMPQEAYLVFVGLGLLELPLFAAVVLTQIGEFFLASEARVGVGVVTKKLLKMLIPVSLLLCFVVPEFIVGNAFYSPRGIFPDRLVLASLEAARSIKPDSPQVYRSIAHTYNEMKEPQPAQALKYADLGLALKDDSEDVELHLQKAKAHNALNQDKETFEDFDKILALRKRASDDPYTMSSVYSRRGDLYLKTNEPAKALADYSLAINLCDDFSGSLHERRAAARWRLGDRAKAMQDINLVAPQPNEFSNQELLLKRAAMLDLMGDRKAAIKDARRYIDDAAISADSPPVWPHYQASDPEFYLNAAFAFHIVGDETSAAKMLSKAKELGAEKSDFMKSFFLQLGESPVW